MIYELVTMLYELVTMIYELVTMIYELVTMIKMSGNVVKTHIHRLCELKEERLNSSPALTKLGNSSHA